MAQQGNIDGNHLIAVGHGFVYMIECHNGTAIATIVATSPLELAMALFIWLNDIMVQP